MNKTTKKYIQLKDLEVYQLSRELSRLAWKIYEKMDWKQQKIMGDQFITSMDSVGANIAEGYGRYHYLDRIRFYYNSRASMLESINHWSELLLERKVISNNVFEELKNISEKLSIKLNNFITATYNSKRNSQ